MWLAKNMPMIISYRKKISSKSLQLSQKLSWKTVNQSSLNDEKFLFNNLFSNFFPYKHAYNYFLPQNIVFIVISRIVFTKFEETDLGLR